MSLVQSWRDGKRDLTCSKQASGTPTTLHTQRYIVGRGHRKYKYVLLSEQGGTAHKSDGMHY